MPRYVVDSSTRSSTALETMSETSSFHHSMHQPPPLPPPPPTMTRPSSNVAIGPNIIERKPPKKLSSFSVPRHTTIGPGDSSPTLPNRFGSPPIAKPINFRAAEKGKSDLLPTHRSTPRHRSFSSAGLSALPSRSMSSSAEQLMTMTRSLRSRKRTSTSDDEVPPSFDRKDRPLKPEWSSGEASFSHRPKDTSHRSQKSNLLDQYGQTTVSVFGLLVAYLVLTSYYRALDTTEQVVQFKQQESMMMLHLQRVEQQTSFVLENLGRIREQGIKNVVISTDAEDGQKDVETDLIWKQIHQVRQMEDEVSHEVRQLQTSIQRTDRSSITHTYGEGPVQIQLDFDLPGENTIDSRISLLLWYDTPHAGWTLLKQIEEGKWNGAQLSLDRSRSLVATSTKVTDQDKLNFVESSQKTHEAWTVGLSDAADGGMNLFINLQDNTALHKHDVCIGKVIDGFGALQKLVDLTRSRDGTEGTVISVTEVTASHLKTTETTGLL